MRWTLVLAAIVAGCAPGGGQMAAAMVACGTQGFLSPGTTCSLARPASSFGSGLMVFGGPGHQFVAMLGDGLGMYGDHFSPYSACNPYALDPPYVVDSAGNYYGRLTVNRFAYGRYSDPSADAWLDAICQ